MDFEHSEIAVLGAGSWGTALALLLAQDGGVVRLWDRTESQVAALRAERENRRYLSGHVLPANLHPLFDLNEALAGASCVCTLVSRSQQFCFVSSCCCVARHWHSYETTVLTKKLSSMILNIEFFEILFNV